MIQDILLCLPVLLPLYQLVDVAVVHVLGTSRYDGHPAAFRAHDALQSRLRELTDKGWKIVYEHATTRHDWARLGFQCSERLAEGGSRGFATVHRSVDRTLGLRRGA